MRRLNKLYEAKAMLSNAQSRLILLHALKFDRKTKALLRVNLQESYDCLERAIETTEILIETETRGVK